MNHVLGHKDKCCRCWSLEYGITCIGAFSIVKCVYYGARVYIATTDLYVYTSDEHLYKGIVDFILSVSMVLCAIWSFTNQ